MPVPTGTVHAHILTKPARSGLAVSRLELIEPGAATCVQRYGWAVFKKLGTYHPSTSSSIIYRNVFFVPEKMLPSEASANNSIYR